MNIEENIEIIKNHLMKIQRDTSLQIRISIEKILADREEWKTKAEWFKRCCNKNFDTAKQLQDKANKYDALVEKAKRLLDYAENYAEKGEFNNGYCQAINNVLKEEV